MIFYLFFYFLGRRVPITADRRNSRRRKANNKVTPATAHTLRNDIFTRKTELNTNSRGSHMGARTFTNGATLQRRSQTCS